MKYAICNETFGDWPFARACAFSRECGYTGIEIAPFTLAADARAVSPAQRAELKRQAADAGVEIIGLHWLLAKTQGYYLTTPDPVVRKKTADYLADLARLCRDLDGHVLVLGSPLQRNLLPGVTHDAGMDYAADVLRTAAPVFAECNVVLAIEPLGPAEGDFLNASEDGARLMDRVGSKNVRLHLDCKAMSSEPVAPADTIRRFADRMEHFHANDPNKLGPGMGKLDFVPIMRALLDVHYDGWVSVEVFDYSPGPEKLARDSIAHLQETARLATTSAGN